MAKLLKLRRGTTTQHSSFTGAEGEVTIDTTKDTAVVHDGSQAGGRPLAREDMNNVPSGTILGTQLENSGVTAGSYGSSSAIPIVTVDAQGLVTAASTTAIDSTTIANGSASVAVSNNGPITSNANHNFSAGIDVTGDSNVDGKLTITGNSSTTPEIELDGTGPNFIRFNDDSGGTAGMDLIFRSSPNTIGFETSDNGTPKFTVNHNGQATFANNVDIGAGLDVTGNISVTGTVDGVDVAALKTSKDSLSTTNGALVNGVVATTQSASDTSTKVATTAYVKAAITGYNFPSGTKMIFQQTSAPTGWTKITSSVNNKALRVVSGTAGSGGSNAFSNTFASKGISANAGNTTAGGNVSSSAGNTTAGGNVSVSVANATQGGNISVGNTTAGGNLSISSVSTSGTVNSHTLSTAQMPSHGHYLPTANNVRGEWRSGGATGFVGLGYKGNANTGGGQAGSVGPTGNAGSSQGHSHGFSGSSHSHNGSLSGTAHNHNANFSGSAHSHNASGSFSGSAHNHNVSSSFSGTAHNHSISVGNLDMSVQYLDVIIASKD